MHPLSPDQPCYGYHPADAAAPPVVSIVTPYYNTGVVFLETVTSLLRQSLQQWEWIIVNDGSDDPAALRVLLPLRSADARIRVIDQPNAGLSAARNAGAAVARSELIFFLDSDDLLASTALEKLVWSLIARPASSFVAGWTRVFGHEEIAWPRGFDTRVAFLHDNMVTANSLVRRGVFTAVGGFNEARRGGLEDYEFWLRAAAHGYWGHDVHEYLIWIRRKAPETYQHYQWSFRERPAALAEFRAEMRAAYPALFRDGLPRLANGSSFLETHALINDEIPFANRLVPIGRRRILMLLPWIRMGGAEQFALDLVAGLVARGDRVTVCLTRAIEQTWMDRLLALTPDVFDLPALLPPAEFPRFLCYLVGSRAITTIWISHSIPAYQLLPFLRAYCPDVPVVDYNHIEQPQRSGGLPRVGLEHTALIDLHLVASEHLRQWMIARGADPARVEVCTINVDADLRAPDAALRARVRGELGLPDDEPLILFAGRFTAQKRPQLVAEVLLRLRERGARFSAILAGDGEDMPWLRMFAARHRMGRAMQLPGALPNSRVRELLAAADLLLLPSAYEGISLTLYEAMAAGVPAVVSDVGGQRELLTPECGVLIAVEAGGVDAYVAAIDALLADPERRRALGAAARARIEAHFTLPQMIERVQQQLDHAGKLARTAPRPAVDRGVAMAVATLAIEHYQLETRLRHLAPMRFLLQLRHSGFAVPARRLLALLPPREALDRRIYAARRRMMAQIKRLLGRPYNP
ncbi:MAG TPA: glycosyltransferase [Roseiflexaceae bacterium]|nr:glycosyltransferase [Roseiflexaceae bacterium]